MSAPSSSEENLEQQLPPAGGPPPLSEADQLKKLRQDLEAQKTTTGQLVERMQSQLLNPPPSNQPPPASKSDLEKQFFKSPLEMTAQIAQNISGAITQKAMQEMGSSFETLRAVARDKIREKDPAVFDKYIMEIEAKVGAMPQNYHTNIHVWDAAFNTVKGEHMRELVDAAREQTPRSPAVHISQDGGPVTSQRSQPAPKAEKLSEDESRMARNLGLSDDQYKAGKAHIAGQSEKGPSSWDKHITFSSKQKAREARASRNKSAAA